MTESQDRRISELYRQSSQEQPPAHLDRVVMDMARKSIRRRVFAPFGNHWVGAAATVGVVVFSVLLILVLPRAPDRPASEPLPAAPASDLPLTREKTLSSPGNALYEHAGEEKRQRKVPAMENPAFDSDRLLPETGAPVPKAENRARAEMQAAPSEPSAGSAPTTPAERYYLQAGLFPDRDQAERLQARLTGLGFRSDIQALHAGSEPVRYGVRVGPYRDLQELENPEQKLKAMGLEVQILTVQE